MNTRIRLFWSRPMINLAKDKEVVSKTLANDVKENIEKVNPNNFFFKIEVKCSLTNTRIGYIQGFEICSNIKNATEYGPVNQVGERMTLFDVLDFLEKQIKKDPNFFQLNKPIKDISEITLNSVKKTEKSAIAN